MTQPNEHTQDRPLWLELEGSRWILEEVETVRILRHTGEFPTTAAALTLSGPTQKAGTWRGPRSALEAALPQNVPTFGPVDLEKRGVVIPAGDQLPLSITPSRVPLHLGSMPVVVEPEAEAALSKLPWSEFSSLLSTIRTWATSAPVKGFTASAVSEPEDVGWEEVTLEAFLDADATKALRLWDELASALDQAKSRMPESQRRLLDRHFGIHVVWEDDPRQS